MASGGIMATIELGRAFAALKDVAATAGKEREWAGDIQELEELLSSPGMGRRVQVETSSKDLLVEYQFNGATGTLRFASDGTVSDLTGH